MKTNLNKYFDQVYCLYLDKRLDRQEYIKDHVEHTAFIAGDGSMDTKYNYIDTPDLPPKFKQSINYPTWWNSPNAFNAWKCHNIILNDALDKGYERILLLEDDVEFSEDFKEGLNNFLEFEKMNYWDMFYFGCYHNNKSLHVNSKGIRKMNGGGGFHGVALKTKIVELLCLLPPIGPYDWISGKLLHKNYHCYSSNPTIINQTDGFSYIEGKILSKPDTYEEMVGCHIESHSTYNVLKEIEEKIGISLKNKNVVHIGAHDGLEKDIYDTLGVKNTLWIECNPYVFPNLEKRIANDDRHKAFEACLWSEEGLEKEYYFYRNETDGAGGLFKDQKMKEYISDCPMTGESIKLKTQTLDKLAYRETLGIGNVHFLNIDVQGSELEVLKGAQGLFTDNLELIYCEVSWDNIYENGPLLEDIDKFFHEKGYNRIGIRQDWVMHGDAIYIKGNNGH